MAANGPKRKILFKLGMVFSALLLIFVALPLWFPWVWRPLAHRLGIHYSKYERESYGRFALVDVTFTNTAAQFRAEKVEAFLPTVWLWHRCLDREPATYLRAQNWKLEFMERKKAGAGGPVSVYANVGQVESAFATLWKWLPKAVLTNGVVSGVSPDVEGGILPPGLGARISTFPPGDKSPSPPGKMPAATRQTALSKLEARLPTVSWMKGTLSAEIEVPGYGQSGTLEARLGVAPYEITIDSESLRLHSTLRFSENSDRLSLESTTYWRSNRVEASAQFGRQGLLPEQARMSAETFRIPTELLGLKQFEDLTGSLAFQWQQPQFSVHVTATARPARPTTAPPFDIQIHSTGSTESAFIELANISTPWMRAELTPGTELRFAPPFLRQEAMLTVSLNLGRQPWFAAEGELTGQVRLSPAQGKFPAVSFAFSGTEVGVTNIRSKTLALNGGFAWPWLEVSRGEIEFADGSTGSLTGQLQVEQRIVHAAHLRCDGPFGRQFLPAGYSFERASLDVDFSGPMQTLSHSGRFKARDFTSPGLHPLQLLTEWKGEGLNLQRCQIAVTAGKSSLELGGSLAVTNTVASLQVKRLTLQQNGQSAMELEKPCQVSWRVIAQTDGAPNPHPGPLPADERGRARRLVELTSLNWLGGERQIKLEGELGWPSYGRLASVMRSVDPSLLADFFAFPTNAVRIENLSCAAAWTNGPVHLALECSASMIRQGIPFSAQASLKGDGKGVSLQRLAVFSQTQPVFTANGFLPVTITPAVPGQWLNVLPRQIVQLQAVTQTNSVFWAEIASITGVDLLEPRLSVDVSGHWEALRGIVEMRAKQIVWPGPGRKGLADGPAPLTLQDLQFSAELDQDLARVKNLSLLLEGQPVTLSGETPLGKDFWTGLPEGKAAVHWEKASARLKMQDAQIAAFAMLAPKVLRKEGSLNLALTLQPGVKLDGELTVTGASTVPLGTLGVVRDIDASVRLQEHTLNLKSLTASIAGAPVSATGSMDSRETGWLKGALPPFQISVRGTNVPLARTPDSVVRANLNATISKIANAPPMIKGVAELRDSFYLHDLKDLLPGGVSSPSRRPPYFSVEAEPWAGWRLDLAVKGSRFLKVSSPLFRGLVSADFNLTGTLKDPIALGNLRIDSGVVQFPFANLDVTQGFVTLTSDNLFRPQLLVTASVRSAGYDVKMEVTGPADQPLVQFSSSPPLGSEQIALMLTAGVFPRSDFSLSAQQRAGRVALFLGKDFLSQFGLAGQGDRLTIRTGEEISETGNQTYHVEYKLSNRWYLVGEYDRFNAYNAGLKWKIYSK